MTDKVFMVAKGFCLINHYNTLAAFIVKNDRIKKVHSLQPDRCLEFMTDDDYSVEFLFRDDVIYARPGNEQKDTSTIEVILVNIETYGQLHIIGDLIANGKSSEFIRSIQELEAGFMAIYSLKSQPQIKVNVLAKNNGNTIVFDGKKI